MEDDVMVLKRLVESENIGTLMDVQNVKTTQCILSF